MLRFLAAHRGVTVSRDRMLAEVWGYSPSTVSRACDNTVRRLREKLESDATRPDHLLTVHGLGYRFLPPGVEAETRPEAPGLPRRVVHLGRVRIDLTGPEPRAEVAGVGQHRPVTRTVPLGVANELAAAGVPTFVRRPVDAPPVPDLVEVD